MNYRVVLDVSHNSSQLAIWVIIPLFALLPGLIGWARKGSSDPKEAFKGKFFMVISGCGFVFSLVLLTGRYAELHQAKKALQTRHYQVAEGTVVNFVPMPPGGHSIESFEVGKTSFQYGSGWGSIVFNSDWNRARLIVFEGGAVPSGVDGGGFVGALAEVEDGGFGIGRGTHVVI